MTLNDTLDKAIAAHGMWKQRLLSAIRSATSEFKVEDVGLDDRCEFGKWFYQLPAAQRETELGRTVQSVHAAFHVEAARILRLALDGRRDEAMLALSTNSQYGKLSGQILISLTQWKGSF